MIIDIDVLPEHIAKQVLECQEPIYFAKEGQIIHTIATPLPNDDNDEFNFDLDEMKKMVESPRIEVPKFETPEELMVWLDALGDDDFASNTNAS